MSTPVRLAIAADGSTWEGAAIAEIDQSSRLQLVRRCVDVADLLATAATHQLDRVLLHGQAVGLDAGVVEQLLAHGVQIGAIGADASHLGITATVELGGIEAWANERSPITAGAQPGADTGKIVAVWGPTGAPGRTSLAISLATSAAAAGIKTALVDADVYGGSVCQWLGILDEVSGLMAACRSVTNGLATPASAHLVAVGDRLAVLTGVPRADMWQTLRPAAVDSVLKSLAAEYDLVIVDCGFGVQASAVPNPDQVTTKVLASADEVVVVGRVDPIGLARLVRAVEDAGPWPRPPRIVLNGFRSTLGWTEAQVSATIRELCGRQPWVFLPFDGPSHDLALMRGLPLRQIAPTSRYVSRVDRMVAELGIRA